MQPCCAALSLTFGRRCIVNEQHDQLGLGVSSSVVRSPTEIKELYQLAVVRLSAGGRHSAAVVTERSVMSTTTARVFSITAAAQAEATAASAADVEVGRSRCVACDRVCCEKRREPAG